MPVMMTVTAIATTEYLVLWFMLQTSTLQRYHIKQSLPHITCRWLLMYIMIAALGKILCTENSSVSDGPHQASSENLIKCMHIAMNIILEFFLGLSTHILL